MSMFSTHCAKSAPEATVSRNGYRFTATTSMYPRSCSVTLATCESTSRLARMPPCTAGWSVFTLPSSISGKFVIWSTGVTSTPASAIAFALPPVLITSNPASARDLARSVIPVLSETLISARGLAPFGDACLVAARAIVARRRAGGPAGAVRAGGRSDRSAIGETSWKRGGSASSVRRFKNDRGGGRRPSTSEAKRIRIVTRREARRDERRTRAGSDDGAGDRDGGGGGGHVDVRGDANRSR